METDKTTAGKSLLKAFLQRQAFSAEEEKWRFEKACDPTYWAKLNPQLSVCELASFNDEVLNEVDEEEITKLYHSFNEEGYFKIKKPIVSTEISAKMLQAVENLREAGWHEVWCFVYDEFWAVTRTPSVVNTLSKILGANFKALPHVVVHYVHPETGAGWSPHVDFSDREDRTTIWFALSDATLQNGCMYVVGKNKISPEILQKWIDMKPLEHKEIKKLLQATKALPVSAGSVLGWDRDVIHWGALSYKNVMPRVSISVVYIKEDVPPLPEETPLLSPLTTPDYSTRLLAIGKAINYYNIHVLALNKYAEIGKKLVALYKH